MQDPQDKGNYIQPVSHVDIEYDTQPQTSSLPSGTMIENQHVTLQEAGTFIDLTNQCLAGSILVGVPSFIQLLQYISRINGGGKILVIRQRRDGKVQQQKKIKNNHKSLGLSLPVKLLRTSQMGSYAYAYTSRSHGLGRRFRQVWLQNNLTQHNDNYSRYSNTLFRIGTFQYIVLSFMVPGFACASVLAYSMSFLQLPQAYYCLNAETGVEFKCSRDDFCDKTPPVKWRIDWDDPQSLHNWVEELELTCITAQNIFFTPKGLIGLINSMQFTGWAFAATFLPRYADIIGRRPMYLATMIGHLIFYTGIVLSRSRILTTVLMFFLGMMSVGRASIGYLYTLEMIPLKQQTTVGTIMQMSNTLCTILACFYFYYISKQWVWYQLFGCGLNLLAILGTLFFMPESPKFLYAKGKWDELRNVMNKIARVNGHQSFSGRFIDEIKVPTTLLNKTEIGSYIDQEKFAQKDEAKAGSLLALVRMRSHFQNLLILVCVWIASSFNFYLINYQLKYIKGSVFLNTFTSAMSEFPAQIGSGLLYRGIGIRMTLAGAFGVAIKTQEDKYYV